MPCGRFGGACAPFAPPWVRHWEITNRVSNKDIPISSTLTNQVTISIISNRQPVSQKVNSKLHVDAHGSLSRKRFSIQDMLHNVIKGTDQLFFQQQQPLRNIYHIIIYLSLIP